MKKKLFGSFGEHIKTNWLMIFLSVCVVGAGALSFYTVKDINDKLKNQSVPPAESLSGQEKTADSEEAQDVQTEADNVPLKPKATEKPVAAKPQPTAEATEAESLAVNGEKDFVLPVEGKIFAAFSADELVYNKTMDDWRTHNGIDIRAAAGTAVKAACDGTVTAVYTDGMLGCVVEVENSSFTVRYCGLDKDVSVQQGDRLCQNQPIGKIGEIPLELAEDSHLHLEIIKNGRYQNPDKYLG